MQFIAAYAIGMRAAGLFGFQLTCLLLCLTDLRRGSAMRHLQSLTNDCFGDVIYQKQPAQITRLGDGQVRLGTAELGRERSVNVRLCEAAAGQELPLARDRYWECLLACRAAPLAVEMLTPANSVDEEMFGFKSLTKRFLKALSSSSTF